MVREILFRGICIRTGNWVESITVQLKPSIPLNEWEKKNQRVFVGGDEIHPETLGQYSGMNDVNKKRVYEGDLCDRNGHEAEVWFHNGAFGFKKSGDTMDHLRALHHGHALYNFTSKLVVKGTIHDQKYFNHE